MAGRFPGAKNTDEYWYNLKHGVESIGFFSDKELEEAGEAPGRLKSSNHVKAYGVLEGMENFDATFFEYTAREAEVMDPQVRIFHECVWAGLEDAGCDPESYQGLIGLYAGASANLDWEGLSLLSGKGEALGGFAAWQLRDKDFLSFRVSFKLNLRGPTFVIYTACSTSLVAIHQACRALLSGECTIALAGGVSITKNKKSGYIYQPGMVFSPDGHCRAFDARAEGTISGNGAGIVVLKRLKSAIHDGDHIYAVIKGSSVNNDGSGKAGFTAPAVQGQALVIRTAQRIARVEPESIGYLEAHGTGTTLGDPIEIEGLKSAFKTGKKGFCAIGSVKTNIGHLDVAAGVAGFIKTVMAIKHRQIPPSLNFETPNPKIDFKNSPFYVNHGLTGWQNEGYPLRAGVSSFGIGGTNAHVILEEFSEGTGGLAPLPGACPSQKYQLILLSAKTESALEQMTRNLVNHLKNNPHINLADAAYTLQVGRKSFEHRKMLVCSSTAEAVKELSSPDSPAVKFFQSKAENPPVIFMFAGLGSQYVDMGRGLYETEPIFREEIDRCFEILQPLMAMADDIKEILYPGTPGLVNVNRSDRDNRSYNSYLSYINRLEIAQAVVFILEYALAKLLMKWGIKPYAMIGYSFGEYAAACLAGVFSLQDALRVIVSRGQALQKIPAGAMMSVPISRDQLEPWLNDELSLAIDNGPSCVVSGSIGAIDALEKQLKENRYMCMRLQGSHAIHSHMMAPILEEFKNKINKMTLKPPGIPYISNVTGQWINVKEAADPGYWVTHLRNTVRFAEGMKELLKIPGAIFLEIGPGHDISTLTQRYLHDPQQRIVNTIKPKERNIPDVSYLLNKIGRLWLYGIKINWQNHYHGRERQRIPLPTYPFEGQRYWIEGNPWDITANVNRVTGISSSSNQASSNQDAGLSLYVPSWRPTVSPLFQRKPIADQSSSNLRLPWLMFMDESGFAGELAEQLKQEGAEVCCVKAGSGFVKEDETSYFINPREPEDYDRLMAALAKSGKVPGTIVHLWGITNRAGKIDVQQELEFDTVQKHWNLGFYTLLYLTRTLERQRLGDNHQISVNVVTDLMQRVHGEEAFCPGKSAVLALVKAIPHMYANVRCRSIDVSFAHAGPGKERRIKNQLAAELQWETGDREVVYRGNDRLVPVYEPLPLTGKVETGTRSGKNSVYLIVGSLKGFAYKLVEYLAQTLQPGLVFIENNRRAPAENQRQEETAAAGAYNRENSAGNFHVDLKEELDFLNETEEKIGKKLDIKGIQCYPGLQETLDRLCCGYILDYFKKSNVQTTTGSIYNKEDLKKELGISPVYDKFYDFFTRVLKEDRVIDLKGNRLEFLAEAAKVEDPLELAKKAKENYPLFTGTINLLQYCTGHYDKALTGEIDAVGVLFPAGSSIKVQEEYQDPAKYSYDPLYISLLQEFIAGVVSRCAPHSRSGSRGKKLRILEIGAGQGVLTQRIIRELQNQKAENVEYYFTDIGNYFVINAKKEAAHQGIDFMKFSVFDISKDPVKQGFEPGSFDMIVGLDVVHMVKFIEKALVNLKRLLVPNGIICLIEGTTPRRWDDMVNGLAEGWWYFQDRDLRKDSPLLSLDSWKMAFKKSGFAQVFSFPGKKEKKAITNCGLIAAQKGKESEQAKETQEETRKVPLPLKRLEELGARVEVLEADPAHLEKMQGAIARAELQLGKITGIIYAAEDSDSTAVPDHPLSVEAVAKIMVPRVKSTLVLEKLFKGVLLDFFIFCSSVQSPGTFAAAVGNSAVNVFFNSFAFYDYRLAGAGGLVISINKDYNLETGTMEANNGEGRPMLFEYLLSSPFPQVVISHRHPENLHGEGESPESPYPEPAAGEPAGTISPANNQRRELQLSNEYVAPGNQIQQTLAAIWQDFLDMEQVGIMDDFLELGADSLVFVTLSAKIHKMLNVKIPINIFFSKPNIKELADYISQAKKEIYTAVQLAEKKERYVLSSAQKRMYFTHLMAPENTGYNIPKIMEPDWELDKKRLEETFYKLIRRHDSLRTSFALVDEEPMQRIHEKVEFSVEYNRSPVDSHEAQVKETEGSSANCQGRGKVSSPVEIEKIIRDFIRPFDLSRAPLLRVGLKRLSPTPAASGGSSSQPGREHKYLLMVDMHHIISDGISVQLLTEEFQTLYKGGELPPLKSQYKEYAQWQNSAAHKKALKVQESYWLQQFRDELPVLEMPLDYEMPAIRSFAGNSLEFELTEEETGTLKQIAHQEDATMFMVIITIYYILLSKISGQEDIIIGTPVSGRGNADLDKIIGMFVNMLVLRNFPTKEKTFTVLLAEVKKRTIEAFDNQDYQYEDLLELLPLKRDVSRNPLFDAAFGFQKYEPPGAAHMGPPGITSPGSPGKAISAGKKTKHKYENKTTLFDLSLYGIEKERNLVFFMAYSTKLFKTGKIKRLINYFKEIVSVITKNKDIQLKNIDISHGLFDEDLNIPQTHFDF